MRAYRIESTAREYRGTESTETTGEQSAGSEQNARVYRDEGTESLQSRECSARGRDEGTESREYRVESTECENADARVQSREYRLQRESTQRREYRNNRREQSADQSKKLGNFHFS